MIMMRYRGAQDQRESGESMPTVMRRSVPLSEQDLQDLALIRSSPEALRAAGVQPDTSEAALLAAVLRAGLDQLKAAAVDVGYAAYAVSISVDPQERAHQAAQRRRPAGRRFHADS
jgi:hypothetical protein